MPATGSTTRTSASSAAANPRAARRSRSKARGQQRQRCQLEPGAEAPPDARPAPVAALPGAMTRGEHDSQNHRPLSDLDVGQRGRPAEQQHEEERSRQRHPRLGGQRGKQPRPGRPRARWSRLARFRPPSRRGARRGGGRAATPAADGRRRRPRSGPAGRQGPPRRRCRPGRSINGETTPLSLAQPERRAHVVVREVGRCARGAPGGDERLRRPRRPSRGPGPRRRPPAGRAVSGSDPS